VRGTLYAKLKKPTMNNHPRQLQPYPRAAENYFFADALLVYIYTKI